MAVPQNPQHPRLLVPYVPIDSLSLLPFSPRVHPRTQLKKLKRSIREFGFVVPILINDKYQIVDGEACWLAAKGLGFLEVPVIRFEHLSDEQIRALRIALNKLTEGGGWDIALLKQNFEILVAANIELEVTAFDTPEIDLIIEETQIHKQAADIDPADDVPEAEATAVSRTGDLWHCDEHRLLCDNSLVRDNFLKLTAGRRARMVLQDDPYNVPIPGHASGNGAIQHDNFAMASGEMSEAEFIAFLTTNFRLAAEFSCDGSLHYHFIDFRHIWEMLSAGRAVYSDYKHLCVWAKNVGGMGSFYRSRHELIFIFKNGTAPHTNNVQLGKYGRSRDNVWLHPCINSTRRSDEEGDLLKLHATPKPVRLLADAILDCTKRGDIVLDSFIGIGSTLIAAHRVGRVCFGMDIEPRFIDTAIRRWQADTGQDAIHADTGETFNVREQRANAEGEEVRHGA